MTVKLHQDVVDFHSHVLPGADHGAVTIDETASQLKFAKDAGVTRIIATPHFYPHRHIVEKFLSKREKSYMELKESGVLEDAPQIRLGAEVLLCENLYKLPRLNELCVYGSNTILLELPFSDISDNHVKTVSEIINMGLDVVLAHADKYLCTDIEKFIAVGARLQLNADAFTSVFRKKSHIYGWLDGGKVVAIGSDIHKKDKSAYKRFVKAKKKIGTNLDYLCKKSDEIWEKSKDFFSKQIAAK